MLRDTTLINAALEQGLLAADEVSRLQLQARRERRELLAFICFSTRTPLAAFYRAYAELHAIAYVDGTLQPDAKQLRKLPRSLSERRLMVPLLSGSELSGTELSGAELMGAGLNAPGAKNGKTLAAERTVLAVADPEDHAGIEQARRILGGTLEVRLALPKTIQRVVGQHGPVLLPAGGAQGTAGNDATFDPVALLDELFEEAFLQRASDIHFEPQKENFQIRLRVDGRLMVYPERLSLADGQSLMSRMKVLTGMDIAEQRQPQDGNMSYVIAETGTAFDVRAACLPTRFGERATLRLLGTDAAALTLEQIGFSPTCLAQFRTTIRRPYGMVLVTGPTGSGKSTTLYSALQEIVGSDTNIMTAEDPIEYVMEGVSQVHVSGKVSFPDALRSFLRHDPDVIMVGEIRDGETASIALKAAMTGHLVFSTLHTNSAIASINRLVDMGVERYLIGSTLVAVIAQRLVRRLCSTCKEAVEPDTQQRKSLGVVSDALKLYRPCGCAHCMGSGYRGRLALFETLWIDDAMGELICCNADEITLRREANHFSSLARDGRDKLIAGLTSWEELARLSLISRDDWGDVQNSPGVPDEGRVE